MICNLKDFQYSSTLFNPQKRVAKGDVCPIYVHIKISQHLCLVLQLIDQLIDAVHLTAVLQCNGTRTTKDKVTNK